MTETEPPKKSKQTPSAPTPDNSPTGDETTVRRNPFASPPKALAQPVPTEPIPPESLIESEPQEVVIQELVGQPIHAQHYHSLEHAFKRAGKDCQTPAWVCQTDTGFTVLTASNPQQAGFQQTRHPWQTWLCHSLARLGAPFFGIRVTGQSVNLPNGVSVSLPITSWKGADGKTIRLYQALKLPNGTWLRIKDASSEKRFFESDSKRIMDTVASRAEQLEQSGCTRVLPQAIHVDIPRPSS